MAAKMEAKEPQDHAYTATQVMFDQYSDLLEAEEQEMDKLVKALKEKTGSTLR